MKASTKAVFEFLQAQDEPVTLEAVAEATGLTSQQITGAFNMGIQKPGYGKRVVEEGSDVKLLVLTDEGRAVNLDEVQVKG